MPVYGVLMVISFVAGCFLLALYIEWLRGDRRRRQERRTHLNLQRMTGRK